MGIFVRVFLSNNFFDPIFTTPIERKRVRSQHLFIKILNFSIIFNENVIDSRSFIEIFFFFISFRYMVRYFLFHDHEPIILQRVLVNYGPFEQLCCPWNDHFSNIYFSDVSFKHSLIGIPFAWYNPYFH